MPLEQQRPSHFDLMLVDGDRLRTWALERWPLAAGEHIAARTLPPHRLDYLDYEGPVSGGRGTVQRISEGCYELLAVTPQGWIVRLIGPNYRCRLSLEETQIAVLDDDQTGTSRPPAGDP